MRQTVSPETQERLVREMMERGDYVRSRVNRAVDLDREIDTIFDGDGYES
ncbi:hypothetical protein [Zhongshania sp.]